MLKRLLPGLAAFLLLLTPGCKEADGSGGTTGVALYTFDTAGSKVLVWTDLNALYDSTTTPAPTYQFTAALFSKMTNMAWGGMCLDGQRGLLYMVSDTGDILRLSRIRSQNGTVPDMDLVSFRLASGDRLTNSKFGQAALDDQNDRLYITENGDNATRIWVVANASGQMQDASIPLQALQMTGDAGGTGVAASSGSVYAFMADGNPVPIVGSSSLTGPRLRKGTTSGFDPQQVILGSHTNLGIYGSLALDTANGFLYCARHATDAPGAAAPIQVFRTGQFGSSPDQTSAFTVGTATDQPDLRVLTHPGTKDWLVGLRGQGTVGFPTLILWKSPLGGTASKVLSVGSAATVLRGVAVDGNAS
jgi:hypothetical protein